jgi:sodium pump decarboxylase gamma subunit
MTPMTTIWGDALSLAGRGFGIVFLILIILAVVTWLIGLAFQRARKAQEKAKSAAEAEAAKTKS